MIYIYEILFISIVGTLLHFTYDFSNHNKLVGIFSAVNESTWEHIKIALTPYFIWMIIEYFITSHNINFFFAKVVGIISIIVLIPLLFYGYKAITKKSFLVLDILIFYISIISSVVLNKVILNATPVSMQINYMFLIILFIILLFYFLLTIRPLKNKIFEDPITNKYGFKGHGH